MTRTALTTRRKVREAYWIGRDVTVELVNIERNDKTSQDEAVIRITAPHGDRILRVGSDGCVQAKNIRPMA